MNKLNNSADFEQVFNNRKLFVTDFLRIHYKINAIEYPRLGMIVSKKNHKKANRRNYMKRVIRELFRQEQYKLQNVDIVVRVQGFFTTEQFQKIKTEFAKFVHKMEKNCDTMSLEIKNKYFVVRCFSC